ncbi:transcription initiation factor TFIID subunit [Heterostelium album PN500]|uniref:Transcription initiation factor TFIID subunit 13 n=1 Tax=Heterostelium pallidum (strain ATCC 26659 / Pp 5 / PN500) TaxID=670386 RepID=D3BV86_HETP5|nr:transcription initiation factor TFIID subunit [Heterostelium album PN500]EFA74643.1 transcription initiation factor TFIID subunit [Heterostelium album PN500]|eukprot:XP_020426777.1 transcription initiation factor TFIID subunit [Heterostelium album PN500]
MSNTTNYSPILGTPTPFFNQNNNNNITSSSTSTTSTSTSTTNTNTNTTPLSPQSSTSSSTTSSILSPSCVNQPTSPSSTTTTTTTTTSTNTISPPIFTSAINPNSVLSSLQQQPAEKIHNVTTVSSQPSKRRRTFTKDLKHMMYGFGDVRDPLPDTVDLLEEIVFEYIQEMTLKAAQVSTKRGRFQTEDLVFLVRKDAKKYHRVIELLKMNEELKKAKRAFDDTQEPVDEE